MHAICCSLLTPSLRLEPPDFRLQYKRLFVNPHLVVTHADGGVLL